jgi:hypothetical protein
MDAAVKQMIDGFRMGVDAQSGMISDKSFLEPVREVIAEMEAVASEPGMDMMKFQERLQSSGLMGRYGDAMAKLGEAQAAGIDRKIEEMEEYAAEAKPVDLKTLDITDLEVVLGPHRQVYNTTVKDNDTLPHQKEAYEKFFALAEECETIPEFNRRAKAEGHYDHLGLSATWDGNVNTFNVEVQHQQPDMITYGLDALEAVRDNPFPETVVYALNRLALLNERTMAVRQSRFEPVNGFAGELSAYLILVHTEEQRQKVVNMHGLMKDFTGLDVDGAFAQPYFRQLLEKGDAQMRAEHGPDYLGIVAFLRAGWFLDASLSPEEKKEYADKNEVPRPPACPYPYRTGPVGGVSLALAEPPFAVPTDQAYPVKLTITNGAAEPRKLDAKQGLRMRVFAEEGAAAKGVKAKVPAELPPGASAVVEGDLFAWGLPKEERLYMVAFGVGVSGEHGCELAAKYAELKGLSPQFIPNHFLEPFEGGAATAPAYVFPHRPVPAYPFPMAID